MIVGRFFMAPIELFWLSSNSKLKEIFKNQNYLLKVRHFFENRKIYNFIIEGANNKEFLFKEAKPILRRPF